MRSPSNPPGNVVPARGALARLFPPWACTALCAVGEDAGSVHSEERDLVARAVPLRRAEFFAGRRAAHEALAALGADVAAVGRGHSGEPLWPSHVVGSISHTDGLAAAVAARSDVACGIGLDVETLAPDLDPAVERLVLRPDEQDPHLPARVAFAVKECVFKCLFPLTRRRLDFDEVRVEVDLSRGTFRAELDPRFRLRGQELTSLEGRVETTDKHVFTGLWLGA